MECETGAPTDSQRFLHSDPWPRISSEFLRWSSNQRPILCQCKLACTHTQHLFVSSYHPDAGTVDTTTARPIGLGARLGSYYDIDILVTLSQPTSPKAKQCISKSMSLCSLSLSVSAGWCTIVTLPCLDIPAHEPLVTFILSGGPFSNFHVIRGRKQSPKTHHPRPPE